MSTRTTPDPAAEPAQMPIGYVSMNNSAQLTPDASAKKPPSRLGKALLVLILLGGGGYAAWTYVPQVRQYAAKLSPTIVGSEAGAEGVTRTLTIKPGLLVTVKGDKPVQFTGVRLFDSGKEVPCMRGWLGTSAGNVNGHLGQGGENPFKDSSLRLRFAAAGTGPKVLTLSYDEEGGSIREIDPGKGVAEIVYRGGNKALAFEVTDGSVALAEAGN